MECCGFKVISLGIKLSKSGLLMIDHHCQLGWTKTETHFYMPL